MSSPGDVSPGWVAVIRADLRAALAFCSGLGGRLRAPEGEGAFALLSPLDPPEGWRGWGAHQLAPLSAVLLCVEAASPLALEFLGHVVENAPASCALYVALCVAVHDEAALSPQEGLLAAGADDVLVVGPGDPIDTPRLLGAALRWDASRRRSTAAELRAREEEQARSDERASRALAAGKKALMWQFASDAFPSIPPLDAALCESAKGVGETVFDFRLGGGASGQVFLGRTLGGRQEVVKVCKKNSAYRSVAQIASLERELLLLRHLPPHPNVVRGLRVLHGKEALYIFMPCCGSLNLQKYLCLAGAPLSPLAALAFARQALDGVAHLHANLVAHRDLKGENFALQDSSPSGRALTLIDFGLAAVLVGDNHRLVDMGGTHPYVPPEVFAQGGEGYLPLPGDMWGLGCLFLELARGAHCLERFLGWVRGAPSLDEVVVAIPRLEDLAAAGAVEDDTAGDADGAARLLLARAAAHVVKVDVPARWGAPRLRFLLGDERSGGISVERSAGDLQGRALRDLLNRFSRTVTGRSGASLSPQQWRLEALESVKDQIGDDPLLTTLAGRMSPLCLPEGVSLALEIADFSHARLLRKRIRQAHYSVEIRDDSFDRFLAIVAKKVPGASAHLRRYRDDVLHGTIIRGLAVEESRLSGRLAPGAAAEVHEAMCASCPLHSPGLDLEAYYSGSAASPLQLFGGEDAGGSLALGHAFWAALVGSGRVPLSQVEGLCRAYRDEVANATICTRVALASATTEREDGVVNERVFAEIEEAPFTRALFISDGEGLRRCLDVQSAYGNTFAGTGQHERERLGAIHAPLGLTSDHYDTMLDALEKGGASARRVELCVALRPWVLGKSRVIQQQIALHLDEDRSLLKMELSSPLPLGEDIITEALKLFRSKGWSGGEAEALALIDKKLDLFRAISQKGITAEVREKLKMIHKGLDITHAEFDAHVAQALLPRLGVQRGGAEAAAFLSLRDLVVGRGDEHPLRLKDQGRQKPLTSENLTQILRLAVAFCAQSSLTTLRRHTDTVHGRVPCAYGAMQALLLRIIGGGSRPALSPAELRRFREIHRTQCGLTVHDFEGFLRGVDEAARASGVQKATLRTAFLLVGSWLFELGELQNLDFLCEELTGFMGEIGGPPGLSLFLTDVGRRASAKESMQAYLRERGGEVPMLAKVVDPASNKYCNYWMAFLSGKRSLTVDELRRIHMGQGVTPSVFQAYMEGMEEALVHAGTSELTSSILIRACKAHESVIVDEDPLAPSAAPLVPTPEPLIPILPSKPRIPRRGGGCPSRGDLPPPRGSPPGPP